MIGIYIPHPKRLLILFRVSYNLNMNLKLKYKLKRFDSFLLWCLQEKKKKKSKLNPSMPADAAVSPLEYSVRYDYIISGAGLSHRLR